MKIEKDFRKHPMFGAIEQRVIDGDYRISLHRDFLSEWYVLFTFRLGWFKKLVVSVVLARQNSFVYGNLKAGLFEDEISIAMEDIPYELRQRFISIATDKTSKQENTEAAEWYQTKSLAMDKAI